MAAIGEGWVDGAWTEAGWVTAGDGAWVQASGAPGPGGGASAASDLIRLGPLKDPTDYVKIGSPVRKYGDPQ